MSSPGRVVVAMSGGVDSSVAAALLKEDGYEVIGITMQIWPPDEIGGKADMSNGCCSLTAVEDARRVAQELEIPHYTINLREAFARQVISNFCQEYTRGRTPNPCIRCNQYIKFGSLLRKAISLDARFVATGHYARIEFDDVRRRYILRKGYDSKKDQSYVLYMMTQEQLRHTLMPLGKLTKQKVRQLAEQWNLGVAGKAESQEICFIPSNNYGEYLREYLPLAAKPGPVLDKEGKILGKHKGILFYTIGQRKGMGIAGGVPLYVIAIDRARNAIIVGGEEDVYADGLVANQVNYVDRERLIETIKVKAKIRYSAEEAEATLTPKGKNRVQLKFGQPQRAVTPGQAVVFYRRDEVIGGGTISSSCQAEKNLLK